LVLSKLALSLFVFILLLPVAAHSHGMEGTETFLANLWLIAFLHVAYALYVLLSGNPIVVHFAVCITSFLVFGAIMFGLFDDQQIGILFYIELYMFFVLIPIYSSRKICGNLKAKGRSA
jgi:hypothetical protein